MRILGCLVLAASVVALASSDGGDVSSAANNPAALDAKVSLTAPYPQPYFGAPDDRIKLAYAVFELARQAMLGYNFLQSQENVGTACSEWIAPNIEEASLREALNAILEPRNLNYKITGDELVLIRSAEAPPRQLLNQRVSLRPPYDLGTAGRRVSRIPVHLVVQELCGRAGLEYDRNASDRNTAPACRRWIRPRIEEMPLHEALVSVLRPLGLSYELDDNTVTLTLPDGGSLPDPMKTEVSLLPPFPVNYPGARADSIMLHYAVIALAQQAGLEYDWARSREVAGAIGQRRIRPDIRRLPLDAALESLLRPYGLTYQVEDHRISLAKQSDSPADALRKRVTLLPPYGERQAKSLSLYLAIQMLLKQSDLSLDARESVERVGTRLSRRVSPEIRNERLDRALVALLRPHGLTFSLADSQIVVRPIGEDEARDRLKERVTLKRPYPKAYEGAPAHKIQLYHAIRLLAEQAELPVNWSRSRRETGPELYEYVYPDIERRPLGSALDELLNSQRLTYEISDGQLVILER